ncbi:MAG: segregation/condensation protein A [Fimbriiglobus sp.]|jgi:segregation and condensation protein A|nr:segregation/condensation protein A [Fimbriiglobus sp.]
MSYLVHLDTFHGPLDLLLYLVKKEEVDVGELPLARVADQFLDHLRVMTELDVEGAGDFLVIAATLMEIKSRSLVPADDVPEGDDDGPDPRRELVKQLLEYRKFKDAARLLEEKAEGHAVRLARQPTEEPTRGETAVRPVELWDLVSAFARFLRETQASKPQAVVQDDTPQGVYEEYIRERLRRELRVAFIDLFTPPHHRARLIGLFLAALEVIRRFEAWVEQPEPFGEIWLSVPR